MYDKKVRRTLEKIPGCYCRILSNLLTGCTCLSHRKGQKRKNKKNLYCQDNLKFEKDAERSFPPVLVNNLSIWSVTGRFYSNSVQQKVKEFCNKKRPSNRCSRGPSYTRQNVILLKSFLTFEKLLIVNHSPYSFDLSPGDL